jgi:copper(I)-binding protein
MIRFSRAVPLLLALVSLGLAACSDSTPIRATIEVEGAWARASAGDDANSAAYMILRNPADSPRRLTGADCDRARMTQLHRTVIDESGMARMGEVASVEVPAGGELVLEPGGYHLMLIGVGPLAEGDTLDVVLRFDEADSLTVRAPVRPL